MAPPPLPQPLVVALSKRVHYGDHEVQNHRDHELLENRGQNVPLLFHVLRPGLLVQLELLAFEESLEGHLEPVPYHRHVPEPIQGGGYQGLVERDDHKQLLDVHFYDGLPEQRRAEERPEGHKKMTTSDPGKVK